MFFDSHAHLDRRSFGDEVEAVVARAAEAGVVGIVAIGSGATGADMTEAVECARRHPGADGRGPPIRAAVGVHPHEADRAGPEAWETLARLVGEPEVVAVGETGLDFHYAFSSREGQVAAFRRQIGVATAAGLPLVVHCREAEAACLEVLRSVPLPDPPGVIHCFTSGAEAARAWRDMGFLLSIPGVVTFRNAEPLLDAVRSLPVDALLVETDSPYLAPVPFRGRRNEPAHVRHTVEAIAALKCLSVEDVARVTRVNAERLFGIAAEGASAPRLAYVIRDSLYVNMTNRCTLRCTFCGKHRRARGPGSDYTVKGHDLRVGRDPPVEAIVAAIEAEDPGRRSEVVFCGYGEPLLRLDDVRAIAGGLKAGRPGVRIRVNTDGLASLVHGRDVPAELAGLVDVVSVSLNAPDAATYARICPSRHGEAAFHAVCDFLRRAREVLPEVWATAVALPGLDVEACRRLAEATLGVRFRARPYDDVG
ncbi:MAG: YchF/TatD family DNA exonuclease [Deltaproteobacteria bacterium]|nr:YchF/TatD family DNA exonuclease [Deltaproteobacteria bacterium]